jgi:AcrR family transcriptional regulator
MARTRALDYHDKRRMILRHAAVLFARYGFAGTSITMIASACGVSKALLYHYYADKDEVLFDIISTHLQELVAVVEAATGSTREPRDRVQAIAAALLESYRDADAEHQVQIANLKLLPREQQEILRTMERRLVSLMSDALAEAIPAIGRGPLLKPFTMSAFGMLNWHYLWFREGKGLSRNDYACLVTQLLLSGAPAAVAALAESGCSLAAG